MKILIKSKKENHGPRLETLKVIGGCKFGPFKILMHLSRLIAFSFHDEMGEVVLHTDILQRSSRMHNHFVAYRPCTIFLLHTTGLVWSYSPTNQ